MELTFLGNITYVVYTSSLITLEYHFKYDNPVFHAIWEEIEDLIQSGNFKTIDYVEIEIENYEGKQDFLKLWVKKWKKLLVVSTDAQSFNTARPIMSISDKVYNESGANCTTGMGVDL